VDATGSKPLPSRNDVHYVADSTGIGKPFLARAFEQKACRDGFTAYFATAAQLFRELEMARAEGSYAKSLRGLGQVDALIVDDWAMSPLADTNAGRSWKSATRDT
jgi:DNA replication protein DnaC